MTPQSSSPDADWSDAECCRQFIEWAGRNDLHQQRHRAAGKASGRLAEPAKRQEAILAPVAPCPVCQQNMADPATIACLGDVLGFSHGETAKRTPYENPNNPELTRCHDCGVTAGSIHHWGCDMERCPVCRLQLLTCEHGDDVTHWAIQSTTGAEPDIANETN